MILETYKVGPLECNCTIFACPDTKEAVIVDPGGDADKLLERIATLELKVRYVVITHAHFDHVLAARAIKDATGARVCLNKKDIWLYLIMPLQYRMADLKGTRPPLPNKWLKDGELLTVGGVSAKVLHTPGHSPGSCCVHVAEEKVLFSGDTLFRDSVGAWKYPGGSFEALLHSIESKLMVLPDDTRVIPGHGDETSIGHERAHNPYRTAEVIAQAREEESRRPSLAQSIWLIVAQTLGLGRGKYGADS